jgi:hypothetical protein
MKEIFYTAPTRNTYLEKNLLKEELRVAAHHKFTGSER